MLAVVDPAKGEVVERFSTDHYPYAVATTSDGRVYVSAWGDDTISIFPTRPDGRLMRSGRLQVGRRPSALLANASGSPLFLALAGSDQIAIVDSLARHESLDLSA